MLWPDNKDCWEGMPWVSNEPITVHQEEVECRLEEDKLFGGNGPNWLSSMASLIGQLQTEAEQSRPPVPTVHPMPFIIDSKCCLFQGEQPVF